MAANEKTECRIEKAGSVTQMPAAAPVRATLVAQTFFSQLCSRMLEHSLQKKKKKKKKNRDMTESGLLPFRARNGSTVLLDSTLNSLLSLVILLRLHSAYTLYLSLFLSLSLLFYMSSVTRCFVADGSHRLRSRTHQQGPCDCSWR